jgi:large subunit ribosomal protein L25
MKQKTQLQASPRQVLGKEVRFLRRKGITPANVFGHGLTSVAVQIDTKQLRQVLNKAGTSQLIALKIEGESEPRNVLVRDFQINPLSRELLHIDLYQVSMTERMTLDVPLVLVGESMAVKKLAGVMLQNLNSLKVECLPGDIPAAIEVDLIGLAELGDAIHVKEITLGDAVTILNDPEEVIVSVIAPAAEEAKFAEVTAAEAEAGAEAAPAAEKAEGKKGAPKEAAPSE